MEKKQVLIVQEAALMRPPKTIAGHERGGKQAVLSSHLMSLNRRHVVHEIASRFRGSRPPAHRLRAAWFLVVLS